MGQQADDPLHDPVEVRAVFAYQLGDPVETGQLLDPLPQKMGNEAELLFLVRGGPQHPDPLQAFLHQVHGR